MTAIEPRRKSRSGRRRDAVPSRPDRAARRNASPRRQARLTASGLEASETDPAADGLGRRLAAGDTEALREVYARYGGPMMTAAVHHLAGDRRLAEEALQGAMLKAWRAASTFDTTRPLAPWLYSIVRHCAIDIRRHEHRHQLAAHDAGEGELRAGETDVFESAATAWAVRAALERLPAQEYSVLRLMYFEGLTQGQVAARLGVPLGTVKTRAARAHRRLRGVLDAHVATG